MRRAGWTICPAILVLAVLPAAGYADYDVAVESNIVYATGTINAHSTPSTKPLLLDVYRPVGAPGTERSLVLVHGGSFVSGDRRSADMIDAATYFAARGWVCFSIEYRLAGDDPPAPSWVEALGNPLLNAAHAAMVDTKRAVRWARAHAADYGCHTNRVAGLGHSAGAYCIIQAAVSDESDFANDSGTYPPDQWADCRGKLNAAVDVSGGCSNMLSEIDALDSPLMIWHGDSDGTVPYSEAAAIHARYETNHLPHRIFTLAGIDHGAATWLAEYDGRNVKEHAEEFLDLFLGLRVAVSGGPGAIRLSWPSVSNAVYDIEHTPDLSVSFTNIASDVTATGDFFSVETPVPGTAAFFRVRIDSGQP